MGKLSRRLLLKQAASSAMFVPAIRPPRQRPIAGSTKLAGKRRLAASARQCAVRDQTTHVMFGVSLDAA